jgi:hypothetical protein
LPTPVGEYLGVSPWRQFQIVLSGMPVERAT